MASEEEIITIPLLRTPLESGIVHLINIPPPVCDEEASDVSRWDENEVIWIGSVIVSELENIRTSEIKGLIQYINADGSIFGETIFDPLVKEDLLTTNSKWKYRVLLTHEDKKIALGLVWKDRIQHDEFDDSLKRIKKDSVVTDESLNSFTNKLNELNITDIKIGIQDIHSEEDDSDDDFGEFVN